MTEGMRILIVEDIADVWRGFKFFLERAKYVVDIAETRRDAFQKISEKLYDLALVDLQLKDDAGHKGGIDVLEYLQRLQEGTKVVVVSGTPMVSDAVASWRAGIDDFIEKNKITESHKILETVEAVLHKYKRASFGGATSLNAYLAAPDVTPIWEGQVQSALGASFDVTQQGIWRTFKPHLPILRLKSSPSFQVDHKNKCVWGEFWTKNEGSAIWVSIASTQSSLREPPEELGAVRSKDVALKGLNSGVWLTSAKRSRFEDALPMARMG